MTLAGFANGLGAGSNSLIARCIGVENYEATGNSAIHSMMLSIIVTVIVTILTLIILRPLLFMMGAEEVIGDALNYGYIVMVGSFSIFIPAMIAAIFRSQGEIKRASYPLMYTVIINMILDQIIYILDIGIIGAAIAKVIAATIPMFLMMY